MLAFVFLFTPLLTYKKWPVLWKNVLTEKRVEVANLYNTFPVLTVVSVRQNTSHECILTIFCLLAVRVFNGLVNQFAFVVEIGCRDSRNDGVK